MKSRVMGLEIETAKQLMTSEGVVVCNQCEDKVSSRREGNDIVCRYCPNQEARNFILKLRERYGNLTASPEQGSSAPISRAILPNMGQAYLDREKLIEVCTPECTSLSDLLLHKRVVLAIIVDRLREFNRELSARLQDPKARLIVSTRTTDAFRQYSISCHENYEGKRCIRQGDKTLNIDNTIKKILTPFLVARKILEGSGHFFYRDILGPRHRKKSLSFGISQRLPFINMLFSPMSTDISSRNRDVRPMIHEKNESLGRDDGDGVLPFDNSKRWEIFSGENNQSPFCDFVKTGSVALLIEMAEEGFFNGKPLPRFADMKYEGCGSIENDLFARINVDLACRNTYEIIWPECSRQMKLYEILDVYAGWMKEYLIGDNYSEEERTDVLYREKLAVVEKIFRVTDAFARGDIFALEEDIDWVMKLRWMQEYIEDTTGIVIGDNELDAWENLSFTLRSRWHLTGLHLREFEDMVVWREKVWHYLDPEMSHFRVLEECELINPVDISGEVIDISDETVRAHMHKVPANPPNRTTPRQKLWTLMRKLGLSDFLVTEWARSRIVSRQDINLLRLMKLIRKKNRNVDISKLFSIERSYIRATGSGQIDFERWMKQNDIAARFPWSETASFNDPQDPTNATVDYLVKLLRELIAVEKKKRK